MVKSEVCYGKVIEGYTHGSKEKGFLYTTSIKCLPSCPLNTVRGEGSTQSESTEVLQKQIDACPVNS